MAILATLYVENEVSNLDPDISISVVSHGQAGLVNELLRDIDASGAGQWLKEVIITCNIPEQHAFKLESATIRLIENDVPKGFGENHNTAFEYCQSSYFCVVNPDIRLSRNPLPILLSWVKTQNTGVVGPKVVNLGGEVEDSARPYPNLLAICKKLFGSHTAALYPTGAVPDSPDWIAGMFMLFNAKAFVQVDGFDERYFLYYEDVDICARLRMAGWGVRYCKDTEVIHNARRDSHGKLRYLKWHLSSMLRFFIKHPGRLPRSHRNSRVI